MKTKTLIINISLLVGIIAMFGFTKYKKKKEIEVMLIEGKECAENVIAFHNHLDAFKLEYKIKEGQKIDRLEYVVKEYAKKRGVELSLTCPNSPNQIQTENIIDSGKVQFKCSKTLHSSSIKVAKNK